MTEVKSFGISFPKKVLTKIDSERGDIPRSRYLLRVLEKQSEEKEEWKKNCDNKDTGDSRDSLDSRFGSLQSSESRST
jgi:hypothetical protein